jgi:hypothetical protein
VGAGYDSNIDFRIPDGPSSWAVSPRGSLARVFRSSRGQLRLGGNGGWIGYPEQRDRSRYNANVGLDGSYRPSLNTTWGVNASYEWGYSDRSQILSDQGVLLPLVQTRTAAGGLEVNRKLGARSSLLLAGRVHYTDFDQEDPQAARLADGQYGRGSARFQRSFGANEAFGVEYSLAATLGRPPPQILAAEERGYYLTHYGSLQWSHGLGPQSGFGLEAGMSYTPESAEAGLERRASFYGGASYRLQGRRSSLALFARREVTPAFGLGVSRVQNRFGVSATIWMGRAWRIQMAGSHSRPETPDEAPVTYSTADVASMSLSRSLGRHLAISAEGRYHRRGATGAIPEIEAYRVGLFLSLDGP